VAFDPYLIISADFRNGDIKVPDLLPREMNPTFPELVFHFLGSEAAGQRDDPPPGANSRPNPWYGVLGRRHFDLLLKKFDEEEDWDFEPQVLRAWTEWVRIGCYKNGEKQRLQLWCNAPAWMMRRQLYSELQRGVTGSRAEQEIFYDLWVDEGTKEAKKDKRWDCLHELQPLYEADNLDIRDPEVQLYRHGDPEKSLGKQIYTLSRAERAELGLP